MPTVQEQFEKFRSRLEITQGEQDDAIRRRREICDILRKTVNVTRDFLTGSYDRHTKTRPLRDVDVFVVLADARRSDDPKAWLDRFNSALADHYGEDAVTTDPPAVRVDFGVIDDERVMSIEAVPAIEDGNDYLIPDPTRSDWMSTNPERHAEMTSAANAAFGRHWVPLVKMVKKWNQHIGAPVVPSFLLEVMALELMDTPWVGPYAREVRAFFAAAADRVADEWPDPAGLGSPVSDELHVDDQLVAQARAAMREAEAQATRAIRLEQAGQTGAALDVWQALFGPRFAKS
jgi:hypothetical protein